MYFIVVLSIVSLPWVSLFQGRRAGYPANQSVGPLPSPGKVLASTSSNDPPALPPGGSWQLLCPPHPGGFKKLGLWTEDGSRDRNWRLNGTSLSRESLSWGTRKREDPPQLGAWQAPARVSFCFQEVGSPQSPLCFPDPRSWLGAPNPLLFGVSTPASRGEPEGLPPTGTKETGAPLPGGGFSSVEGSPAPTTRKARDDRVKKRRGHRVMMVQVVMKMRGGGDHSWHSRHSMRRMWVS